MLDHIEKEDQSKWKSRSTEAGDEQTDASRSEGDGWGTYKRNIGKGNILECTKSPRQSKLQNLKKTKKTKKKMKSKLGGSGMMLLMVS